MSYQYTLKEEKSLVKIFDCIISGFEVGKNVTSELTTLQETAHLKGFRKGKAPIKVIEEMYFGKVFFDVVNKQASECISAITKEKNYKLASQPKVELDTDASMPADRNVANIKDLKMAVTLELLPEIKDIDLSKIDIQKYSLKVEDSDIEGEIKRLALGHAIKEDKGSDAVVQDGDIAIIDATGYLDGKEFDGGKVVNHSLHIGSKSFIDGFESGLIGKQCGETVTLDLAFPENYHMQDIAGKKTQFIVKILNVLTTTPPAMNDDFAKKFGFNTIEEFRNDVKKSLAENYENTYMVRQKADVFDKLQPLLTFDVPHSMLHKHDDKHTHDDSHEHHHSEKEISSVRLSIFLMDYAEKHKLEVTKSDFTQYIDAMARMYGQNPQMIYSMYENNKEMQQNAYNILFENKIFEHIYDAIPTSPEMLTKEIFDQKLKEKAE
jgi:trigger factor